MLAVVIITILGSIPCIWSDAFLAKLDYLVGDLGYTFTALFSVIVLSWVVGIKRFAPNGWMGAVFLWVSGLISFANM